MRAQRNSTSEALILSGLAELAAGALTGGPCALAILERERARKLGIRSTARLRQWHLDLRELPLHLACRTGLQTLDTPTLKRGTSWNRRMSCRSSRSCRS